MSIDKDHPMPQFRIDNSRRLSAFQEHDTKIDHDLVEPIDILNGSCGR